MTANPISEPRAGEVIRSSSRGSARLGWERKLTLRPRGHSGSISALARPFSRYHARRLSAILLGMDVLDVIVLTDSGDILVVYLDGCTIRI